MGSVGILFKWISRADLVRFLVALVVRAGRIGQIVCGRGQVWSNGMWLEFFWERIGFVLSGVGGPSFGRSGQDWSEYCLGMGMIG